MKEIELHYSDIIICDPCCIKGVESRGEVRFDALKVVKEISGDDGEYAVKVGDEVELLTADSGRVWAMKAEFDCRVVLSGGCIITHAVDDIKLLVKC